MDFSKKIVITIIIIVLGYFFVKLIADRKKIKMEYEIESFVEGALFSMPTKDEELKRLRNQDLVVGISNLTDADLPLRQYCIKASYNTAFTGNYINLDMIKYVFTRGCRFVDFEVFSMDNRPYVACSNDTTYTTIDTQNKELLKDVLSTVVNVGFSTQMPNGTDPIFVHLRIKTYNTDLYNKIADDIKYATDPVLFTDPKTGFARPVNGDTILKDLKRKLVIVVDKKYVPTYKTVKDCRLTNYVNMESNSDDLLSYSYNNLSDQKFTSPIIKSDNVNTNVKDMTLVVPDNNVNIIGVKKNAVYHPMVINYGAQIVMYPFYIMDMYLGQYETAFTNGKSAFVPLSNMITYLKKILNPNQVTYGSTNPSLT